MTKKVAILLNSSWNIVNFRAGLLKALYENGYELVAIAPSDEYSVRLSSLHCRHLSVPMKATGINPFADTFLLIRLWIILRRERPDIILTYTVKPNIYGSIAGHSLGIPVLCNIAGLGAGFSRGFFLRTIITRLFKLALRQAELVFFQNNEDLSHFIELRIVQQDRSKRLPGSGIDLQQFPPSPSSRASITAPSNLVTFILIARLLREKGIVDYVSAARIVKASNPNVCFQIVGFIDERNINSVTESELKDWVEEGVIEYLGRSDDVRIPLAQADCMVLPSYYREGVPRVLLEAAAMGLPIITCNTVGCRDAVDHGVNGWLCEPRNPVELAQRMSDFIALSPSDRKAMGMAGRMKVEREFDEAIVISEYLQAIRQFT